MAAGSDHNPMHQFLIRPIVELQVAGVDVSFTNSTLFMFLAVGTIMLFLTLSVRNRALVPGRWQSMAELSYEFIAGMVKDNVGTAGRAYFPFIFTLFMFVLICNLLGMLPYSFTVTSHIAVTFAMALCIFLGVTVVALVKHGMKFFSFFMPEGTPLWLAPLMVMIEVIAYLARPVTLSIRLAANMMAGHILLKVIAGFVISMGWLLGWLPLGFLVVLIGFEVFVAVLQAYIFTILTCVYLNDALHLH